MKRTVDRLQWLEMKYGFGSIGKAFRQSGGTLPVSSEQPENLVLPQVDGPIPGRQHRTLRDEVKRSRLHGMKCTLANKTSAVGSIVSKRSDKQ